MYCANKLNTQVTPHAAQNVLVPYLYFVQFSQQTAIISLGPTAQTDQGLGL